MEANHLRDRKMLKKEALHTGSGSSAAKEIIVLVLSVENVAHPTSQLLFLVPAKQQTEKSKTKSLLSEPLSQFLHRMWIFNGDKENLGPKVL